MRVAMSGLGAACDYSTSAYLNPICWFTGMVTTPGHINEATCTSGTVDQQAACAAGVQAAQNQAMSDPSYCCAVSDWPSLCALGLTQDDCGVSSLIPSWGWLAIAVGAVVLLGGKS